MAFRSVWRVRPGAVLPWYKGSVTWLIISSSLSASAGTSAWVGGLETVRAKAAARQSAANPGQQKNATFCRSRYAEVVKVALAGLELAAHFARDQRRVIGRQAGIEDRGGQKQALVCFPSPRFYACPPVGTSREMACAYPTSKSASEPPSPSATFGSGCEKATKEGDENHDDSLGHEQEDPRYDCYAAS